MATKVVKKTVKRKKANGYQMPGHIPKGEVLKDTAKNEWVIDTSIGIGGFGEIYSAFKSSDRQHNNYVVKIEPSENGPLFCERTVYCRIGKKEDIDEFMKLRKLKTLGMPQFYGFGTHELGGIKYRFLVMERYGKDLWSLFLENGKIFPSNTVLKIGVQILDVLEYLHVKSYVHADIKGANLLLGIKKGLENQVFLVDFGLASRFATEYKPNPKKAHNGTIEYTSRDAHLGVTTRRGDIEILGYNMLHWLSSNLPWEKLKDPASVHTQKEKHIKDWSSLMKTCFKDKEQSNELNKYFKYLSKMEPLDEPNYDELRKILKDGIKKSDNKLDFKSPKSPLNEMPRSAKNRKIDDDGKVDKSTKTKNEKDENRNSPKKTTRAKKPATATEVKRSWKDFPTIVNGAKADSSEDIPVKAARKKRKE